MTRSSHQLNPETLFRLARAFRSHADKSHRLFQPDRAVHVLEIGYLAKHPRTHKPMWSQTVYHAHALGYLARVEPGMYRPTPRFWAEVKRHEENRRRKADPRRLKAV